MKHPELVALAAFVAGVLIQAWRTSRTLKCSMWNVLKSGGGPGEEKSGGGPGEER